VAPTLRKVAHMETSTSQPTRARARVKRSRHVPRVCHSCQAPMAGQGETCWRCDAEWASEEAQPPKLRLIPTPPADEPAPVPVAATAAAT